ncbi:MAG: TadE family protein [Candidatus Nanopelagicales bacterium]
MVDFTLVTPLVIGMVLAMLQLAFTLHTHAIVACAAEDAVRVAAAYNGDIAAGERRLRVLMARDVPDDAIASISWTSTLNTLTLRVRTQLPLLGPIGPSIMTTTASAYHEVWAL